MRVSSPQIRSAEYLLDQLVLVESGPDIADAGSIGDRAQLRSGAPFGLVVDVAGKAVTVAWRGAGERTCPAICLRRFA